MTSLLATTSIARACGRWLLWRAWLVVALAGSAMSITMAAPDPGLRLSEAEQRWLAAHPVIRIGVDPGFAPYAFLDEQGRFRGVAADFADAVSGLLGIRMELVPLPDWTAIIDAAKARRIDVITTATWLPERESFLSFTRMYIPTPLVIITRADAADFESPDEIRHRLVALVTGYAGSQKVLERYPDLQVYPVKSPQDGLRAVSAGEADAFVGVLGVSTWLASQHGLSNLKVNAGFEMVDNGQNYGVRSDWPELVGLLDKALAAIPEEEKTAIFHRWVPVMLAPKAVQRLALTEAEKAWILAQPAIRIGMEAGLKPYQFLDADDHPAGLVADFLALMAERVGLRYQITTEADPQRLLERAKQGEIDVIAAPRRDNGYLAGFNLTRSYYVSSLMAVTRPGDAAAFGGDVRSLFGRPVAVAKGGLADDHLQAYPKVRVQHFDDIREAIEAVAARRIGIMVGESDRVLRTLEITGTGGISIAGPLENADMAFRMAVRPDWPILTSVLNKAAASITPEEASSIRRRWIDVPLEVGWNPRLVVRWSLLAAALVLVGYSVFWWQNRRLRAEVARRRSAEEEAKRNSKELETFSYAVSHDLKAPLRRIDSFSQLLCEEHASQLDAVGRDFLQRIHGNVGRMNHLIDDLLAYSRLERRQLARERIDVRVLIDEVVAERADDPNAVRYTLRVELPVLFALADRDGLRQVLSNLIDNAIKYSATRDEPQILITGSMAGSLCRFQVRDNGVGFDMAYHDKIFEVFQRAHAEKEFAGTGVGLALVRRCVQRMGGRVWAESAPEQGATFFVELPA